MNPATLGAFLRARQEARALVPAEVLDAMDDQDLLESYLTCSRCDAPLHAHPREAAEDARDGEDFIRSVDRLLAAHRCGPTAAEFKTLRESLGLSPKALADVLAWKGLLKAPNERTILRWEDGSRPAPADVVAFMGELSTELNHMALRGLEATRQLARECPDHPGMVLLRYASAADYHRAHGDLGGMPHAHRTHAAGLGRFLTAAKTEGLARWVRIIDFDAKAFESWRRKSGAPDSAEGRSAWAAFKFEASTPAP